MRAPACFATLCAAAALAAEPTLAEKVARRIGEAIPGARVHVTGPDDLEIELPDVAKVHGNLANVRKGCDTSSDCEQVIQAYVSVLKDGASIFKVPDLSQLRVRVSGHDFLELIEARLKTAPKELQPKLQPVTKELTKGLWLTLVIDSPNSLTLLQRGTADKLGKTDAELFQLATENLRKVLPKPTFQATVASPRLLIQSATTEGIDSAYVVLPDLLVAATGALGPEVVLAVPARDTLLAARAADAKELLKAAGQLHGHAPYPVSPALYRLDAKGLAPYP